MLYRPDYDQNGKKIRDNHHLIILAKNLNGWKNIVKLHNLSWKDNRFFYDPRITLEDLMTAKLIGHPKSKERRNQLGEILNIGMTNGKQLHKRLMMFQMPARKSLQQLPV